MAKVKVHVETREGPSAGRQISQRRHGTAQLDEREQDLRSAIAAVVGALEGVLQDRAAGAPAQVGSLEVSFNVAFEPDEGVYLCSSASDATFAVKLSMTAGPGGAATVG